MAIRSNISDIYVFIYHHHLAYCDRINLLFRSSFFDSFFLFFSYAFNTTKPVWKIVLHFR